MSKSHLIKPNHRVPGKNKVDTYGALVVHLIIVTLIYQPNTTPMSILCISDFYEYIKVFAKMENNRCLSLNFLAARNTQAETTKRLPPTPELNVAEILRVLLTAYTVSPFSFYLE